MGQELPIGCRIAVIANDALGNYVVCTPLFQMLHAKHHPSALDFYTGRRTEELWKADPNISNGFAVIESSKHLGRQPQTAQYDFIINIESALWAKSLVPALSHSKTYVCGHSFVDDSFTDLPFPDDLRGDLAKDPVWISDELTTAYPFLDSPFIGEILCRLAYLEGPIPPYAVPISPPTGATPKVLIAVSASLPEKLWEPEKWFEVLSWLKNRGHSVGLIGAHPIEQQRYWIGNSTEDLIVKNQLAVDLRGKLSLPEVVGALKKAQLVFTIDNGIMHLAAAVDVPVVGLFREGYHRLWAPPATALHVIFPDPDQTVADIPISTVKQAIVSVLSP